MSNPQPNITINVDLTNPGQFFACCGLLELADRLWPGAEGWFVDRAFCIKCAGTLDGLMKELVNTTLEQLDPNDDMASPMRLPKPFDLTLDWWTDQIADGKQLQFAESAGDWLNLRSLRSKLCLSPFEVRHPRNRPAIMGFIGRNSAAGIGTNSAPNINRRPTKAVENR